MGSKRPWSREHGFKKAREHGAKEINLGSREPGQKGQGAGSKGQGAGSMASKRLGSREQKRFREQGAIYPTDRLESSTFCHQMDHMPCVSAIALRRG